jgi:hypothetical protein
MEAGAVGSAWLATQMDECMLDKRIEHHAVPVFVSNLQAVADGFEMLSAGTVRHGVWEWRAMRQKEPLRQYIVFSIANLDRDDIPRDAQLHVGADNERAFTKRVVARSIVGYDLYDFLGQHLPTAVTAVSALTEDDLDRALRSAAALPT